MESITIAEVVTPVVTELTKTISKGAGEVKLLQAIKNRFLVDQRANRALLNFESDPTDDDYVDIFQKHLTRLLEEDKMFFKEVTKIVQQGNLQIVIATGGSKLDDIEQQATGSGHIQRTEASDKSTITGVKQTSNEQKKSSLIS